MGTNGAGARARGYRVRPAVRGRYSGPLQPLGGSGRSHRCGDCALSASIDAAVRPDVGSPVGICSRVAAAIRSGAREGAHQVRGGGGGRRFA